MNDWNVLFVGLGPLGRMIVGDYLSRRLGRVAGVVDADPSLAGRRVGEVLGGEIVCDVKISRSTSEEFGRVVPKSVTCAVVATSSDLVKCMPTLRELLSCGISVVSTCEELLYPWLRHEAAARELDELCMSNGARCVGTGVNPGFLMDTLPVALTAVCREVRRVRVERYQDATTRRIPFQQKIGAALSDAEFDRRVKEGVLRHVGLGESIHFIDRYLSMGVVKWSETIEPVRAARNLTCSLGDIPKGGVSGVHQTARAWNAAGDEVIALDFQAAIGQENPRDRVVIEGEPSIESVIPGAVHGDVATSAITLNAIASLLRAPPGLHTMATLPVTRFARATSR